MNATKRRGWVTRWDMFKGFGFIAVPGEADYYLHISKMKDLISPKVGAEVEFVAGPATSGKRTEALNVIILNGDERGNQPTGSR
jgi:cold shock CspA family protein